MARRRNTGAAQRHLSRVSPADYIRLGPDAAAIKAQTDPKRWAQIVKTAHAQGWTVASALDSSTPAALKQRTNKSITTAAQRQVDTAYKPAQAELDAAGVSAEGLRQKRLSDQASYDQWSSQKASEIAAQVNAAQQQYLGTIKAATDARVADAQNTAATFAAKAGAGGISDLSGSTAQANVTRGAITAQEQARNVEASANASTPIVAQRAAAIPLAAMGAAYKRRSEIEGDFNKSMSDIFTGKLKLQTDKASAQIDAYTGLLKTEMDKASSNRDFQGLQAQLQSKEDIAKAQHQEFLIGNQTKRRGQDVAANTAITTAKLSAQEKALDREARHSENSLDRANRLAIAAKSAQGKQTGPAAQAASRAAIQAIHTIGTMIKRQKNGKLWDPNAKKSVPTRQALMAMGATNDQINVALRWARGAHGAGAVRNPQLLNILPEDVGLI